MRVAQEKTKFFKGSVEILGFITADGAKTDPEKVKPYRNTLNQNTGSALDLF